MRVLILFSCPIYWLNASFNANLDCINHWLLLSRIMGNLHTTMLSAYHKLTF